MLQIKVSDFCSFFHGKDGLKGTSILVMICLLHYFFICKLILPKDCHSV